MSQDKTILIAGMAPGLGTALQARFEQGGYCVVGVSRQAPSPWAVDLTDAQATQAMFQQLDERCPPLAGVIHNAMQFHRQAMLDTTPQTLQSVWQSMVLTAFNTAQAAIPRLQRAGGGSLIFSGASGSLRAGPRFVAFSSAKFALRGLAQALAREHNPDGIHVAHVVIDGLIRSKKTEQRFAPGQSEPLIEPDALAEQYFQLFHQAPSVWSDEVNFRPVLASH